METNTSKSRRKKIIWRIAFTVISIGTLIGIKNYFDMKISFGGSNNKEVNQTNDKGDNMESSGNSKMMVAKDSGKIENYEGTVEKNTYQAPVQIIRDNRVDNSKRIGGNVVDSSKRVYDNRQYHFEGDPPPKAVNKRISVLNKELSEGQFIIKNGLILNREPWLVKKAYYTKLVFTLDAVKRPPYIGCGVKSDNVISMEILQAHKGELSIITTSTFDPAGTMGILNPKLTDYEIELYTYKKIKNIDEEIDILTEQP